MHYLLDDNEETNERTACKAKQYLQERDQLGCALREVETQETHNREAAMKKAETEYCVRQMMRSLRGVIS